MKRLCLISLAFQFLSCSTPTRKFEIHLKSFKNYVLINEDSCRKWNLPITSFKIEYPSQFLANYNYNRNYLTLTQKNDSGYVQQEFSFDKLEGIKTKDQIKRWTINADSMFNNLKSYKSIFLGNEKIGNETSFIARGTINFDGFGVESYKGDYDVLIMLIPNDKKSNGVSMTYISCCNKDSLDQKNIIDSIRNTLEFLEY